MSDKTSVPYAPLQTAITTLLDGHITGGFYDEVPPNVSFPYTALDDPTDTEFEAKGVKGRQVIWMMKIYSKDFGGKFECYSIMKEIVELMTAGKLIIVGWKEVWKTYRTGRVERDPKMPGITYKAILTWLITVCKST